MGGTRMNNRQAAFWSTIIGQAKRAVKRMHFGAFTQRGGFPCFPAPKPGHLLEQF